jgi:hypothetical protein
MKIQGTRDEMGPAYHHHNYSLNMIHAIRSESLKGTRSSGTGVTCSSMPIYDGFVVDNIRDSRVGLAATTLEKMYERYMAPALRGGVDPVVMRQIRALWDTLTQARNALEVHNIGYEGVQVFEQAMLKRAMAYPDREFDWMGKDGLWVLTITNMIRGLVTSGTAIGASHPKPLCRDFARGHCSRGSACPNLHRTSHNQPGVSGVPDTSGVAAHRTDNKANALAWLAKAEAAHAAGGIMPPVPKQPHWLKSGYFCPLHGWGGHPLGHCNGKTVSWGHQATAVATEFWHLLPPAARAHFQSHGPHIPNRQGERDSKSVPAYTGSWAW